MLDSLRESTDWRRPRRRAGAQRLSLTAELLFGNSFAAFASCSLLLLGALAVLGPTVWRQNPTAIDLAHVLQAPSRAHPLGTDDLGRDILTRFNHGARLSVSVGIVASLSGAVIGGTLGIIAGVFGGILDLTIMRLMDAVLAFPPLILVMAVTVGLGVGVRTATVGIVITSVPWYARLMRSDALAVRSRPFIEAARAAGATRVRLVLRHVVPHVTSTLLVQGAHAFGYAILTLSALGFVGLGAQPPTAEWGAMVTQGLGYSITGQWWVGFFPGLGLFLAATAANIYADRLREWLDPRHSSRA